MPIIFMPMLQQQQKNIAFTEGVKSVLEEKTETIDPILTLSEKELKKSDFSDFFRLYYLIFAAYIDHKTKRVYRIGSIVSILLSVGLFIAAKNMSV